MSLHGQPPNLLRRVKVIEGQGIFVEAYGAVGDGVTDDAAAIQSAILAAVSRGGGTVVLSAATYAVTSGLNINASGVRLVGRGAGFFNPSTGQMPATVIKYIGPAGADVLTLSSVSGGANNKVTGCALVGLGVDGNNLAARGIVVNSVNDCEVEVSAANCTSVQVDFGTVAALADARDTQTNDVRYIRAYATGSAIGIRMQTATIGANISLNTFGDLYAYHENGVGLLLGNTDNNLFHRVCALRGGGGAGVGIVLGAGDGVSYANARANIIEFCSPGAGGITAQGTETAADASTDNAVLYLDKENGAADPTVGTSARLAWGSNKNVAGKLGHLQAAFGETYTAAENALAAMGGETVRIRNSSSLNMLLEGAGGANAFSVGIAAAGGHLEINRTAGAGRVRVMNGLEVVGNMGFYGTTPISKPNVTGSRGGNAALASLLGQLAALGLITDSSTA